MKIKWCLLPLAWGLLTALTACAPVGPNYQVPQTKLPSTWLTSGPNNSETLAPEALENWWTLFNDPQLESLIHRATLANYDLQIASSRMVQTRAEYRIASGAAAPQIEAGGSYTNSGRSKNTSSTASTQNLFQAGFDAGWELDFFGGARRRVESAGARLDVAIETHRDLLLSLQAEVARNYLELRATQQRLTTAEKNLATLQKTFELARDRQASGFGNRLDVAQAETLLALNRAQLPALENSVDQAGYRLCLLLGLQPGTLTEELRIRKNIPQPPALLPESLPSELLRRRPDIRSAERQLAAATAEVGVAVAGLFPQFSLTGLLGLQSTNLSNLLSSSSRYWSVGPSISWSLFNGGGRRANVELNQARREEAQITYEKTVLNALGEVESTLLSLRHEEEIQKSLSSAAQAAARALELSTGRYQAGLSGLLDVLVSERALYQSEDQLILSSLKMDTTLVALYKSLGGGWSIAAPTQIETLGESKP